ncbi:MAG: alpha/beta hydrolase [Deltaproteobacteria bacterium]|nr:alpha/beta hydrolase [Deltaproteobacteria bacterium]
MTGHFGWRSILVLLLACAGCTRSGSREATTCEVRGPFPRHGLANTEVRPLARAANGRDYQLHIGLPDSFADEPGRRYPVLYLCDAYWDFAMVKGIAANLLVDKAVPEILIVGLGYPGDSPNVGRLRRYDLTPTAAKYEGAEFDGPSGHAQEFLSVIEHEIIPLVEREYRGDARYRVLAGSSLGGLFTLYAMLARPDLFYGIVAVSPAAQWANDWLLDFEAEFHKSGRSLRGRLFVTAAEDEVPMILEGAQRFDARLRTRDLSGLRYGFRLIEGERHAGTKAEGYNRGLRFAFAPRAADPSFP